MKPLIARSKIALIKAIQQPRIIIIVIFIIELWAGSYLLTLSAPLYQSTITLKVLQQNDVAGLLTESIVYDPADAVVSQVKSIRGFSILEKVARQLGMLEESSPSGQVERVVQNLRKCVQAERIGSSNIFKVTVWARDPRGARDLASTVGRAAIEQNLAEKRMQFSLASRHIEQQMRNVEQQLKAEEQRVADTRFFKPYQERLFQLEVELAALETKYTQNHPQILQTQDQISEIKKKLHGLAPDEAGQEELQRQVEVHKNLFAKLKEKLEETRIEESRRVPDISIVDPAFLPRSPLPVRQRMSFLIQQWRG